MPRYCFNAYSGICFAPAFEVQDLPNLEAARGAAPKVAKQFWVYLPGSLRREALTIEIVEETGQEFLALRFETPR